MLQLHGTSIDLGIIHLEGRGQTSQAPELQGLEFIEQVKSDPSLKDLPLILTSDGWSEEQCATHQESPLGVNAYLRAPFSEAQIFQLIEAVLGQPLDGLAEAGAQTKSDPGVNKKLTSTNEALPPKSRQESPSKSLDLSREGVVLEDASSVYLTKDTDLSTLPEESIVLEAPDFLGLTEASAPLSTSSAPQTNLASSAESSESAQREPELSLAGFENVTSTPVDGASPEGSIHLSESPTGNEPIALMSSESGSENAGPSSNEGESVALSSLDQSDLSLTTSSPGNIPDTSESSLASALSLDPVSSDAPVAELSLSENAATPGGDISLALPDNQSDSAMELPQGLPVMEAPVMEAPVMEAPVMGAPVMGAPVMEAPVMEAPVMEAPVMEAPVMEAPAMEAPVMEASLLPSDPSVTPPNSPLSNLTSDLAEALSPPPGPPIFAPPQQEQQSEEEKDIQAAEEMPYLFKKTGAEKGLLATPVPPAFLFAEPLGDAVVPGGASQSPDLETLKKYLLLREQDVGVLSNQLKAAKEQISTSEQRFHEEKARCAELTHIVSEQREKLADFETERLVALERHESEMGELRFEIKAKTDKARLLEIRAQEAAEETEHLKERVRSDIRKIRVREKELENRLEIMKKDSEALLSAREKKIIELKRKLDLLEFNMDLLQDQYTREKEATVVLKDRLAKAAQVVRVAGGLLETKTSGPEGKEEKAS